MSKLINTAAYTASKDLSAQGVEIRRTHLIEIIAALLSYRTYAALKAEEADSALLYHLEDAEVFVLNLPMGEARANELGLAIEDVKTSVITTACINALRSSAAPITVHVGVDDFYESHVSSALAEIIYFDEDVAIGMAETNASFPELPEMDETYLPGEDLWKSADEWKIEANGVMSGEYDPDGDRMFTGDTLICRGRLIYNKAGRAGLVFMDSSAGGGVDDSGRDFDYEAEAAYWQDQALKESP